MNNLLKTTSGLLGLFVVLIIGNTILFGITSYILGLMFLISLSVAGLIKATLIISVVETVILFALYSIGGSRE